MLPVRSSAQSRPADLGPIFQCQLQLSMGGRVKNLKDTAFPKSFMKKWGYENMSDWAKPGFKLKETEGNVPVFNQYSIVL